MKNTVRAGALAGVLALVVAGCGEPPEETPGATGGAASEGASDYLACLVSDQGGFDDQSFNQSAREGAEAVRVANAAIEAARTGTTIRLTDQGARA